MSEQNRELVGTCHCGAVSFRYQGVPERLVDCNCSVCRRLRALWGHGTEANIVITQSAGATLCYVRGDKTLAFHTCKTCGCTTHWQSLIDDSPKNMAVNMALCDPDQIAAIPIRRFDGADTWQFVDE